MCAITITFIFLKYTKLALSLCIIGNKNTPLNLYYFLTTVNVFFKRIIVTSHILSPQWIPRGVTTCKHLSVNNQNRDQLKHLLCSRSLAKEHHEEGKPLHIAPEAHHRFHKQHRRGGPRGGSRIATRLSREVATMTANVRNITRQNMAMHELLKKCRPARIPNSSLCSSTKCISRPLTRKLLPRWREGPETNDWIPTTH